MPDLRESDERRFGQPGEPLTVRCPLSSARPASAPGSTRTPDFTARTGGRVNSPFSVLAGTPRPESKQSANVDRTARWLVSRVPISRRSPTPSHYSQVLTLSWRRTVRLPRSLSAQTWPLYPSFHHLMRISISSFAVSAGRDLHTSRPIPPKQMPRQWSRTCFTAVMRGLCRVTALNVDEGSSRRSSRRQWHQGSRDCRARRLQLTEGTLDFIRCAHRAREATHVAPMVSHPDHAGQLRRLDVARPEVSRIRSPRCCKRAKLLFSVRRHTRKKASDDWWADVLADPRADNREAATAVVL